MQWTLSSFIFCFFLLICFSSCASPIFNKEQPIPKDLKDKIYPTSQEVPKIYGTPKIHKPSFPLRPIVSSIGSVSYYAAKIIADILSPLVGNTIHHIKTVEILLQKFKVWKYHQDKPFSHMMYQHCLPASQCQMPWKSSKKKSNQMTHCQTAHLYLQTRYWSCSNSV